MTGATDFQVTLVCEECGRVWTEWASVVIQWEADCPDCGETVHPDSLPVD